MMNKIMMMAAAALGLVAGEAQANIGDGTQAAADRWGNPTMVVPIQHGARASYISKTQWFIRQFYNASGVAQAAIYYKPGSDDNKTEWITKEEKYGLWLSNTVGEGANVGNGVSAHWMYLPTSTAKNQMWYSKECQVTVCLTTVLINKAWVSCIIFATDEGLKLLDEAEAKPATQYADPSVQPASGAKPTDDQIRAENDRVLQARN
jgi:hypothetical protein